MDEIYFATNRNLIEEDPIKFGDVFENGRPQFYRVGKAKVKRSTTPDDRWDDEYKTVSESVLVFEESKGDDLNAPVLGSKTAFEEIRNAVRKNKGKRDILLFIHGFASSFESALERAAQLRDEYRSPPRNLMNEDEKGSISKRAREPITIAFCWPTDGRVIGAGVPNDDDRTQWAYFSDRDDAETSGSAIARSFIRLIDFLSELPKGERCKQRIHLVAHSMGGYALRHAVQHMKKLRDQARLPRVIDNTFLMAADEDADALGQDHKLGPIFELSRQIHVYHAADDRALIVSDKTKFNPDRLGERGPRNLSSDVSRINVIDCGKVSDTKFTHGRHQYYRLVPEVLKDVRAVLAGEPADEIQGREIIEPGRRYRLKKQPALRKKAGFKPE
ncbi:MAG: alpha/beta hydrolase [Pseudomonadota bacterium]